MDIQIREFRGKIIQLINSEQLPMEVKRLVISDVLSELARATDDVIVQLLQQQNVKGKEKENEPVT